MGSATFTPNRLTTARERRGMSSRALAAAAGVTAQTVLNCESGRSAPRPDLAERFAAALGVGHEFLYAGPTDERLAASESEPAFFRSSATATRSARDSALANARVLGSVVLPELERHIELPTLNLPRVAVSLDVPPRGTTPTGRPSRKVVPFPHVMEQIEAAAAETRAYLRVNPDSPMPDIIRSIEANGVPVTRLSLAHQAIDAFSWFPCADAPSARPVIFLNADRDVACRGRFTAAHELGHLVMHAGRIDRATWAEKETHDLLEKQAHLFAGALLLPRKLLLSELRGLSAPTLSDLLALKKRLGVSVAAMLSRLDALGGFETHVEALRIQLSRRGWRTAEPFDESIPSEKPEMLVRAMRMLVDAKIDLAVQLGLHASDLEELVGAERGTLAIEQRELTLRLKSPANGGA